MRVPTKAIAVIAIAAAGAAIGYWSGTQRAAPGSEPQSPTAAKSERKVLYYRNPMGLPDTSPVPKKDPMGMDYIAVHEGEEPAAQGNLVAISSDKVQKLGVRTEAAALRALVRTIQAVATIQADERRLHTVAPKFEGWIQKLYVNTTGQTVRRGDALMEVYSPDLITAQQEYFIAVRGVQAAKDAAPDIRAGMQQLVESALQRLRNWDISEAELRTLQSEGTSRQYLTLRAPVSGAILEKPSIQGKRFMPGETLYQIADLSSVWVLADVFEQDLSAVRLGDAAAIRVDAYPGKLFAGKVTFVYPTFAAETRTAKVRIELPNPQGLLKPAMYARAELATSRKGKVLTVSDSALLDSGTRQLVLVERGEGRYEPRPVKTGMRADGYIEVLDGLKEGEKVVVAANFLIDAESNLKAALAGFGHSAHGSGAPQATAPDKSGPAASAATPPAPAPAPAPEHKGH